MITNIIVSLLLLFACGATLYICLQLHAMRERRLNQKINQKSQTRSAAFDAEKPFRGRFREIPSYEHSCDATTHRNETPERSLQAKHLPTLGYSHMPDPDLLRVAYKWQAAKWDPERFGTPTYSDFQRARARAKYAELNRAYSWLMRNQSSLS